MNSEAKSITYRAGQVWKIIDRRHRISLVTATILMAVGAWLNARIPLALGQMATSLDVASKTGRHWGLAEATPLLVALCVYFLVREGTGVWRKYLVHNTCTRIEKDVEVSLVSHLLRVDLAILARDRVGAIHGRIRRSVEGFVRFLHLAFMDFLPALLTATFALIIATERQPLLGGVMAGVIPIASLILIWQISSQKGIRIELLRSKENLDGTVVEQLGGIEYLRAANTQAAEAYKVQQVAEVVRSKEIKHHIVMSLFDCAKALNEGLFFILVVSLSIIMTAEHKLAPGEIVTFAMLYVSVITPLREIHRIIDEAHESALKVGDLMEMMAVPLDRSFEVKTNNEPTLTPSSPALETCNLEVQYLGDSTMLPTRVLKGVTTCIRVGETIGVAGRSGGGKSTWIKALLRLTHPSSGYISVGGVPCDDVSRQCIGDHIGYVGQNPYVFEGTVADNIRYGTANTSDAEMREAAKLACIDQEIQAMSEGYNSRISERGGNLSGGQKQRIALARVILKNPAILILDEATSALDNYTEREVLRGIGSGNETRTVIMVAHRLSTLKDADRILVFDDGRIAETGTYDDLIKRDGLFAELVRSASDPTVQLPAARLARA